MKSSFPSGKYSHKFGLITCRDIKTHKVECARLNTQETLVNLQSHGKDTKQGEIGEIGSENDIKK